MKIKGRIDVTPAQIRKGLLRLPLTRRGFLALFVMAGGSILFAARVSGHTTLLVVSVIGLAMIALFGWSIDFAARKTFERQGTAEVTHVLREGGAHIHTANWSDFTPWSAFRAFFHTAEFLFLERARDNYQIIYLSAFPEADREKVIELVSKHVKRTDGAMFNTATKVRLVLYVLCVVLLSWVMFR